MTDLEIAVEEKLNVAEFNLDDTKTRVAYQNIPDDEKAERIAHWQREVDRWSAALVLAKKLAVLEILREEIDKQKVASND